MKHIAFLMVILLISCSTSVVNEDSVPETDYHRDLRQTKPLDFLLSLKKPQGSITRINDARYDDEFNFILCNPVDSNWFRGSDIASLIPYLDSNAVIARPVFSTLASITTDNHGYSTLANEAYHLILGYRNGSYPAYSTIPLSGNRFDTFVLADSSKIEIMNWWKTVK